MYTDIKEDGEMEVMLGCYTNRSVNKILYLGLTHW